MQARRSIVLAESRCAIGYLLSPKIGEKGG
jgi:hypothetical protein